MTARHVAVMVVVCLTFFASGGFAADATGEANGPPPILPDEPNWFYPPVGTPWNQTGCGAQAYGVGDVNGDGFDDILVSIYGYDFQLERPSLLSASVALFYGGENGLGPEPDWFYQRRDSQSFASDIIRGDFDGDQYGDFVVVDYWWNDVGQGHAGRLLVFHGSPVGPSASPDKILKGGNGYGSLGYRTAGASDVNGDGYGDFFVQAYKRTSDVPPQSEPVVRGYYGSPEGVPDEPGWEVEEAQCDLGPLFVAALGDLNGDGFDDVANYCEGYEDLFTTSFVHIFYGSSEGLAAVADVETTVDDPEIDDSYDLAGVGDVNGDGYADVGVHSYDLEYYRSIDIYFGSVTGLDLTAPQIFEILDGFEGPAIALGGPIFVGDINADGFDEMGIGGPKIARGSEDGVVSGGVWCSSWNASSYFFPYFSGPVAVGDLNGDGFGDVSTSSASSFHGYSGESYAYIYNGIPTPGTEPPSTTTTTIPGDDDDDDPVDDDDDDGDDTSGAGSSDPGSGDDDGCGC